MAQVLQQAANVNVNQETSYEMLDYIVSLREGIMDAWDGVIVAMKAGNKSERVPFSLSTMLTMRNASTRSLRRVNFFAAAPCVHRLKPYGGTAAVFYGCYWVGFPKPKNRGTLQYG